jgi:RNA recognition motif-containing protein
MAYYGHSSGEAAPSSFHGSNAGVNMDAGKIFVGGLSWQTTEETLRYHFEQYGEVQSVEVMRDRNTGDPRGFAFVVFKSDETVDLILKNKPHEINHKVVDVKRAQARGVAPPSIHRDGEVRRGNRVRGLIFATPHTNLTKKMTRFD